MDTGGLCSVTSYLASPLLLFLLAVLGFYPFVCKASVTCVDCSGPGCDHPGICETEGKCFLRRDVNGLLYRGCADNKRWSGLDLRYNGCRWQHYLGWAGARVLWCLCGEPNCNNVTVGVFILRKYSISTEEADQNGQVTTGIQPYNSQYSKLSPEDGGNSTSFYSNITGIRTFQELEQFERDYQLARKASELGELEERDSIGKDVETSNRHSNKSDEAYKQLDGSSQLSGGTEQEPQKEEFPSPTKRSPGTSGNYNPPGDTSPKGSHDHLSDVSNFQEDPDYVDTGGINPTLNDKISVREDYTDKKNDLAEKGDINSGSLVNQNIESGKGTNGTVSSEGKDEGGKDGKTGLKDNMDGSKQSPVGNNKGGMDENPDLENQDMTDAKTESASGGLDSPRTGGAKNNDDYRWLVIRDGEGSYEPIGPGFEKEELNREDSGPNGDPDPLGEGPDPIRGGPDPLEPFTGGGDDPGGGGEFWKEGVREGPLGLSNNLPTRSPESSSSAKEEEGKDSTKGTSTDLPLETRAKCPPKFRAVPHLSSCYHVDRSPRTWWGAAQHCADLDPRSHLVTLDRPGEYEYIVLKVALEPVLMNSWQGWWTSGQYNINIREFTWSTSGHVISRMDPRWRYGLALAPYPGTCVWFVPLAGFKLGNYGCLQPAGAICEINI